MKFEYGLVSEPFELMTDICPYLLDVRVIWIINNTLRLDLCILNPWLEIVSVLDYFLVHIALLLF